MSQTHWNPSKPLRALQHLLLGRVLLKADYTGGLSIEVGYAKDATAGEDGRSGVGMFRQNSANCKLVQPTADGLSSEYETDVTIEVPTDWPLHLTLDVALSDEGASDDFTTERGAYITWQDLPSAIDDLKLVDQDLTVSLDAGAAKFPAIWMDCQEIAREHYGGIQWQFTYLWEVKYYRLRTPGADKLSDFWTDFEQVLNQATEDEFCGAELDQMYVRNVKRMGQSDAGAQGIFDIGRFLVWGQVTRPNPKALPSEA